MRCSKNIFLKAGCFILIQMFLYAQYVWACEGSCLAPAISLRSPVFERIVTQIILAWKTDARRDVPKSIASIEENEIHVVIDEAIAKGEAVAFDITKPLDYYFPKQADTQMQAERFYEGIVDYPPDAPGLLRERLKRHGSQEKLKHYFQLIKYAVKNSSRKKDLRNYRYLILLSDHYRLLNADIVEHCGIQEKTKRARIPTIFLPSPLVNFIDDVNSVNFNTGFQCLLEHADFHLKGEPHSVEMNGHNYRSEQEYEFIQALWDGFRKYQRKVLIQERKNISLAEVKNTVLALASLKLITHIRVEIPNNKERDDSSITTIKVGNMDVEFTELLKTMEEIRLPDKYSLWVFKEKSIEEFFTGEAAIFAYILSEPAEEHKVHQSYKAHSAAASEYLNLLSDISFLEEAPEHFSQIALNEYYDQPVQKHISVLKTLRNNLLRLNFMAKDNIENYPREVDAKHDSLTALLEKAVARPAITIRELFTVRKELAEYINMLVPVTLNFQEESTAEEFDTIATEVVTALVDGIMREAIPGEGMMRFFAPFTPEKRQKDYKIIGMVGKEDRIFIQTQNPTVFKEAGSRRALIIDSPETLVFLLEEEGYQCILIDDNIKPIREEGEIVIFPEKVMLYPSKEAKEAVAALGQEIQGLSINVSIQSLPKQVLIHQSI